MMVYVIGAARGPVKIGISESPECRIGALQTGNPYKLEVLAQSPGGQREEEMAHLYLAQYRLEGEWFQRSEEVRRFIELISQKFTVAVAIARLKAIREGKFEEHRAHLRLVASQTEQAA